MITTLEATRQALGGEEGPTPPPPQSPTLSEEQLAALTRLVGQREQLDSDHRALVEELAKKYRIPMSPKAGFVAQQDPRKEQISEVAQTLKVAALPMAGQVAGGILATAAAPGNIPINLAAQSGGAMAGVKANEMFGISAPDELDYLLSAGAPLTGAIGVKGLRRLTPGSSAAEQQIGAELMRETPKLLEGSQAATKQAYASFEQMAQTPLSVPTFSKTVDTLLGTEDVAKKYGVTSAPVKRAVTKTAETLLASPQGIPLGEVNVLLKRYREKVAGLETKGGEQYGAYKALRSALFKDMDAAVTGGQGPAVVSLKQAIAEAKKSIAKEEYAEILERHGIRSETVGTATFEVIDPTKVLNKLKDIGFKDSVGGAQWGKIEQTLKQLAAIPKPTEGLRTGIGSEGRAIAMTGAGIIGSAAGAAAGMPLEGGVGSALAAYGAIKVHDAVANLFMNDAGRNFLVKLFKRNQGRIGERTAQVIQFAATQLQDQGVTP